MITVEEHLGRILAATPLLPAREVPLAKAEGLCLAESAVAREAVPPWDNSAMDGYAVRHGDVAEARSESPVELRVVADLPAGSSLRPEIGFGEAARIMTGAPIPPGADSIVPVELTDGGVDTVRIISDPGEKRHIRHAGGDKRVGDPVAPAGTVATPEVIAALASTGHSAIGVRRRPRLVTITTGDELVEPGSKLRYGQIPDSNSLLVAGLARRAGAKVDAVRRVGDADGELREALARCSGADLIVLTGGVSVGAYDPVKTLFAGGDEVRFDRVRMQPGKPQAFGRLKGGPLVFGLPGNPVSVWVSFHVFVKPCLRAMQGFARVLDRPRPARVGSGWGVPDGRVQYLPAVIGSDERGRTVAPAASGGSGSHLIGSLAAANGYAIVPVRTGPVSEGDTVATVLTGAEVPPDGPAQLDGPAPGGGTVAAGGGTRPGSVGESSR